MQHGIILLGSHDTEIITLGIADATELQSNNTSLYMNFNALNIIISM